ncbi:hypothetical protein [Lentzea aerocolonigenes]|uniref:hypothetical protein n=1 Tax=Lentzea aerocolonigenes TaxID=68170 RepID=UPI0004C3B599|nr:hypothetical protein [Lentzea aerocolonigenes]MCP2242877.1 hypothetical protein [Lentzea aerocolonigenes]
MNDLEGLSRYRAELMMPTAPDYRVERQELMEAYRVEFRLATAPQHAKRAVDGLVELHNHINHAGIAHPAVSAMARRFELVYAEAAAELIEKRMRGRYV